MPEPNIEKFIVGNISGVKEGANKKLIDPISEKSIKETESGISHLNSLTDKEYAAERNKILEETGTEDLSEKHG